MTVSPTAQAAAGSKHRGNNPDLAEGVAFVREGVAAPDPATLKTVSGKFKTGGQVRETLVIESPRLSAGVCVFAALSAP